MAKRRIIRTRSPSFDYSGSTEVLCMALAVVVLSALLYLPELAPARDFFLGHSETLVLAQLQGQ